jgi:hypothetical protein
MSGITLMLLRAITENFTAQKAMPDRPSGKGWLETKDWDVKMYEGETKEKL